MEFRVSLSPLSELDLQQIGRHISRTDKFAAHCFCGELLHVAESLKTFPHRHGKFAKRPNIRKIPYGTYLIFYKLDEENRTIEILRFWHAARSQNRLRLKEEAEVYATSASLVP